MKVNIKVLIWTAHSILKTIYNKCLCIEIWGIYTELLF